MEVGEGMGARNLVVDGPGVFDWEEQDEIDAAMCEVDGGDRLL